MSATFYFTRTLDIALSGTASSWSGTGVNIWSGAAPACATSGYTMSSGQGTSQLDLSGISLAQTAGQTDFIQTFVSPGIASGQALNSGTIYTVVVNALESNTNAHFLTQSAPQLPTAIVYQFSPGSANKLIASGAITGWLAAGTTAVLESGTIAGKGVSGMTASGDRLVLELWWLSGVQGKATAYTDSIQFGSGNFGYLSVNQTLSLAQAPPSTGGPTVFPIMFDIIRGA